MEKSYTGFISKSKSVSMIEIKYDDLVKLRDNGQLVAGQQYRIVDYDCTTTQQDTASAMHPFDIIVTADNENTLNENARACLSARDNKYFRQEFAEIETIVTSAKFKDGITLNDIEIFYRLSIDIGSEYEPDGLNDGKSDILVELGYATNNDGIEVPAMWKNAQEYVESGEEGTDYQDTYYYVGQDEIDGVRYDKWRKIEDSLTWEDTSQIYILTNVIVDAELEEKITKTYIENNLHTWEIKYSLDNDKTRFAWACDGLQIHTDDECWLKYIGEIEVRGEKYHAWENKEELIEGILLSKTLDLKLGDTLAMLYKDNSEEIEEDYSTIQSSIENSNCYIQKGKGVVYYMKDDKGNECGYDFKNILSYLNGINGYTFTNSKGNDASLTSMAMECCNQNVLKPLINDNKNYLNVVTFKADEMCNNYFEKIEYVSSVADIFVKNKIYGYFYNNYIGVGMFDNNFFHHSKNYYNNNFLNVSICNFYDKISDCTLNDLYACNIEKAQTNSILKRSRYNVFDEGANYWEYPIDYLSRQSKTSTHKNFFSKADIILGKTYYDLRDYDEIASETYDGNIDEDMYYDFVISPKMKIVKRSAFDHAYGTIIYCDGTIDDFLETRFVTQIYCSFRIKDINEDEKNNYVSQLSNETIKIKEGIKRLYSYNITREFEKQNYIFPNSLEYCESHSLSSDNQHYIYLPSSIKQVEEAVFGLESKYVFCEHNYKPDGWHINWSVSNGGDNVIWGITSSNIDRNYEDVGYVIYDNNKAILVEQINKFEKENGLLEIPSYYEQGKKENIH